MGSGDERERVVATCIECGAVYAAIDLPNNGLQPIGRRDGCGSCGGTEFTPLPSVMEGSESDEEAAEE